MPSITRTINEDAYGTVYSWPFPQPLAPYPGTDSFFTASFTIPHDIPASHPGLHLVSANLSCQVNAPKATVSTITWAEHWTFAIALLSPEGTDGYFFPSGWLGDRFAIVDPGSPVGTLWNEVELASISVTGGSVSATFRVNNRMGIYYPTTSNDPSYPIAPENPSTVQNFVLNYTFAWGQPSGGSGNAWCYEDRQGRYHITDGGIDYRRSNFGTPAVIGWDTISGINASAGRSLHDPRCIVDDRQTVRLAYAQHKTSDDTWDGVYLADSNDDGRTWNTGVLLIAGGKHPTVAIGQDGTFDMVIVAAYVGPDGGPGVITARVKFAGDEDFQDPFNFKDSDGNDLAAADDTFNVQQARDDQSRWMMHALIDGDSSTTQFSSYDECLTWQKVI